MTIEEKKEYSRSYYQKNALVIKERTKQWRHQNPTKEKDNTQRYSEQNKKKLVQYRKEYYQKNKVRLSEMNKEWRETHREEKALLDKNYRENNKERVHKNRKAWCEANREHRRLEKQKWYARNKGRIRHVYAWRKVLTNALIRMNGVKTDKTIKLLGYDALTLKVSLETKFKPGMSWENYGEWEIDHIKPVSKFDKSEHPSVVNALTNLQPLWKMENILKSNKFEEEYA